MIKIKIQKNNGLIERVNIKDHANYAEYGEDIVCAGVSTLAFTLINSLSEVAGLKNDQYSYKVDSENIDISVGLNYSKLNEEEKLISASLLKAFQVGVEGISQSYKDFIDIKIQEV